MTQRKSFRRDSGSKSHKKTKKISWYLWITKTLWNFVQKAFQILVKNPFLFFLRLFQILVQNLIQFFLGRFRISVQNLIQFHLRLFQILVKNPYQFFLRRVKSIFRNVLHFSLKLVTLFHFFLRTFHNSWKGSCKIATLILKGVYYMFSRLREIRKMGQFWSKLCCGDPEKGESKHGNPQWKQPCTNTPGTQCWPPTSVRPKIPNYTQLNVATVVTQVPEFTGIRIDLPSSQRISDNKVQSPPVPSSTGTKPSTSPFVQQVLGKDSDQGRSYDNYITNSRPSDTSQNPHQNQKVCNGDQKKGERSSGTGGLQSETPQEHHENSEEKSIHEIWKERSKINTNPIVDQTKFGQGTNSDGLNTNTGQEDRSLGRVNVNLTTPSENKGKQNGKRKEENYYHVRTPTDAQRNSVHHTDSIGENNQDSHSHQNQNWKDGKQTATGEKQRQGKNRKKTKLGTKVDGSTPTVDAPMEVDSVKKSSRRLGSTQEELLQSERFKRQKLQDEAYDKIVSHFVANLRDKYQKRFGQDVKKTAFYLDRCTLRKNADVDIKTCTLTELLPKPGEWKMLVYGKPNFGKTKLCQSLATAWATNKTDFEILIWHRLENVNLPLEDQIIKDQLKTLKIGPMKEDAVKEEEFRTAWARHMPKTLLVLDNYDQLDEMNKHLLLQFVNSNEYFSRACILMTSRPGNNELDNMFNIHVDICGLREDILERSTELYTNDLKHFITQSRVKELYGMSPFFTNKVVEVIRQGKRPQSLYELLDEVVNLLARKEGFDDTTIKNVGAFLLERLKERKFVFKENRDDVLGHKVLTFLSKLEISVPLSEESDRTKSWVVSHLSFMVYFAVRHLREAWKKLVLEPQKETFFRALFCYGNSSNEQFIVQRDNPKHYCVGLVPEIVFDKTADTFQMIQDVDCSTVQSAFQTESLLFRINPKRFPAYQVEEVDDDPSFEASFEALLNLLDFDYLTINRKFYQRQGCDLRFLMFYAEDEEHDKVVLRCVATNDPLVESKMQNISLDFEDSAVPEIHSFLNKLFKKIYRPSKPVIEQHAIEHDTKGRLLIYKLIFLALSSDRELYTKVSLQKSDILDPSQLVTAEVISSRKEVCLSYSENELAVYKTYDFSQIQDAQTSKEIIDRIKKCKADGENVTVLICIKHKFGTPGT